jgi:signal transduction histidine kinase
MSDPRLRENAALLLRRDREFYALRQRFSRALGWLEAVESMSRMVREGSGDRLVAEWPRIVVTRLKLQSASLWFVRPDGEGLDLVSYAGGAPPASPSRRGLSWLPPLLAAEPDGLDNGEVQGDLGEALGLRRFLWSTLDPGSATRHVAALGHNAATWQFHPPFTREDLSFAVMMARMLEAMLGQRRAIGDLTREHEQLHLLNQELVRRDGELRALQEELTESTRLAAVGELAGATAHEVLNPLTSILGRVTRMLGAQDESFEHNRRSLGAVHEAWAAAVARGGAPALLAELSAPSPLGGSVVAEDLAVLRGVAASFDAVCGSYRDDLGFLLREVRRVTQIVDGMRGLSRRRATLTRVSVGALLAEALAFLQDSLARHGIAVTVASPAEVWVEVDRYECLQVLGNVLRNAVLAIAARGRGVGAIAVRVELAEPFARVHVEDDGIGVQPELPAPLPDLRLSGRTDAGEGLGLAVARRLARGLRGDLRLAWTRPGEGSGFVVDLPLAASPG